MISIKNVIEMSKLAFAFKGKNIKIKRIKSVKNYKVFELFGFTG